MPTDGQKLTPKVDRLHMLYHQPFLREEDGQMNGEQHIKRAYEAILENDFEQAIEWFEQAIRIDPRNAAYHYKLSITYARSGKLGKAIEHAETACELDKAHREYQYHLQNLQAKKLIQQSEHFLSQEKNQAHMAVALLKEAVKLDPLAIEARLLMALAYEKMNEFIPAIREIKEILKLDPNHEIAAKLLPKYLDKFKSYINERDR
jgi:tetratricopeptide (TPR) repeat protein